MHIQELSVTDVRSVTSAQLGFSPGINLIVGPNNAGKSTIIKSLYLLQNGGVLGGEDIRIGCPVARITTKIAGISETARNRYFHGKHPLQKASDNCTITHQIFSDKIEKKFIQAPPGTEPEERDFHGLAASENEYNFIYPFLSKRKITHYAIQSSTANANAVMDNFQNLALKVQKVYSQPKTKESYERYCKDILGFLVTPITTEGGQLSLGIYSGYGTTIPIESMGDGVVNVVGLLCILLTDIDKLFLIEEPENDLHPAALKKLLRLIIAKSDLNQFIVSTHSNIVVKHLASVADSRIFYTESAAFDANWDDIPTSKVTAVGSTPQERLWVLENLGYEPFDFELYKGYLLLEESTAERLIRDIIIPHFVPEARHLLRTVAAQGVSALEAKFEDLQKLFLYLHLSPVYANRAWVIADGDPSGRAVIEQLRKTFCTWDPGHFSHWTKDHIEYYYPVPFEERAAAICAMPHGKPKQQEKAHLLEKVVEWFNHDPVQAKPLFELSAAEVITHIRDITRSLAVGSY